MITPVKKPVIATISTTAESTPEDSPHSLSEGDIFLPGAQYRFRVAAGQVEEDSMQASEQEQGFAALDPVSQLLWSQTLRSMH